VSVTGGLTRVSSNGSSPRYQRAYRGGFEVALKTHSFEPSTHQGPLRLVNVTSLEDYLKGVVPWEMNATAPLEALKAQAICARSETLAKIAGGRHAADGFDICDYDHCQGYPGTENEKARTTQAVEQTWGLAIFHDGQVADAVYGTNSGGITASSEDVWRGPPEPYLKSVRDFSSTQHPATARVVKERMTESDWVQYCTQNLPSFAQPSQAEVRSLASRRSSSSRTASLFQDQDLPEFYRWTRVVTPAQVVQAMARFPVNGVPLTGVSDLRVLERAPSGHIKKLQVVGSTTRQGRAQVASALMFEGDSQIRAMFSGRLGSTTALPSSTFVILPRRDGQGRLTAFVIKGAGWGHSVGMCQRGAQTRAQYGWSARQIIDYYFKDVELRPVN
jgi:stage II sporulation protein D